MNAQRLQNIAQRIGMGVTSLGTALPVVRELARKEYTPRSAHYSMDKLDRALDKHVDDTKPGARAVYDVITDIPKGDTFMERVDDVLAHGGLKHAGSTMAPYKEMTGNDSFVNINPAAGREIFAHELGHLASQQTDVGRLASNLRANPKLAAALGASLMVLPGAAAVFEGGDDDLDSSLALASAAALPTMIDEGLATKHGLAIMDKGGMRATLGQRGKLAAGLLSYLAPAMVVGAGANFVGNQFDSNE